MRRYWNRPLGSKLILLLAIALLIEMVAPWQRVCAVTSGGDDPRVCGWRTAYEGSNWGFYAAMLTVGLLLWELLPVLIPRLSMRGWPTAVVSAILGVAIAVCVLAKLIVDNEFQTVWAWVGLGIALALALTAIIRVRFRWETRHKRPEQAQPGGAAQADVPPAPGSSP